MMLTLCTLSGCYENVLLLQTRSVRPDQKACLWHLYIATQDGPAVPWGCSIACFSGNVKPIYCVGLVNAVMRATNSLLFCT